MRARIPAALTAMALAVVSPTLAAADPIGPKPDRFSVTNDGGAKIDSKIKPRSLSDDTRVKVMVELTDDPVAVVETKNKRKLSKAEKDALRGKLRGQQAGVVTAVKGKGGRVEAQVQSAYNGVKAVVKRSDVASLASLPGVKAIHAVTVVKPTNAVSVPFTGAPEVWQYQGQTGKGVKVAVIDTGIDYTHAAFGGPGTVDAYNAAHAAEAQPADPALFGPNAPRIKGGIDLVGDDYAAGKEGRDVPKPDANPLDCQGHGSHVAGTVGGGGVTADGKAYTGPYTTETAKLKWKVGPGVAPEVDLYAVRVFGCSGSTDVTTEAIDWAVQNDMDVINMSLGSSFGSPSDPSAVAASNAAAAGVVVVASAGNSGPNPYITGSPAAGAGVISVAAIDSTESFPGATVTVNGTSLQAVNANGATLPTTALTVVVLADDPATPENESLGCTTEAYTRNGVTAGGNQLAIAQRGTCARVAKAIWGQKAGAAAVLMANSTDAVPPYEGEITENPDTGEPYVVTIPFLGLTKTDAAKLKSGDQVTLAASVLANPGFRKAASFTSGGAANTDSSLRPGISAPGVSIASAAVGTGNDASIKSGTSMAAPHVAGMAALAVQAHPTWSGAEISSTLVSTADASGLTDYRLTLEGNGLVDVRQAVQTTVFATGDAWTANGVTSHEPSLSFGFAEFDKAHRASKTVTLVNKGDAPRTFTLSTQATPQSRPASVTVSPSKVTVPAGGKAEVTVTLSASAEQMGTSTQASGGQWKFHEVSGRVVATSNGEELSVPYLMVPRGTSKVTAATNGKLNARTGGATVTLKNTSPVAGSADVYTLGLMDAKGDVPTNVFAGGIDLRAAGVQSFAEGDDHLLVFAVNAWNRWSTAATNEYDVTIDRDGDGKADVVVIAIDSGLVRADEPDGLVEVFIYDLEKGLSASGFLAAAPTDSSTLLIPAMASDLGITGKFDYTVSASSIVESTIADEMPGVATYDPTSKAIADGTFVEVPAGGSASVKLALDKQARTKALGAMLVSLDNAAGSGEAITLITNK